MLVLDAKVFIEGRSLHGFTVPAVVEEVGESRIPPTVEVIKPKKEFLEKVVETARKTGDLDVLSRADIELLALALQLKAKLVTDDFAIQNVAKILEIEVEPISKSIKKVLKWIWYCPVCGGTYTRKGVCEFCGVELKRRPANKG